MGKRIDTYCDLCDDDERTVLGSPTYIGVHDTWYSLDLCEKHQVALLGDLEALLDSVGAPARGPHLPRAKSPSELAKLKSK